MLVMMCSSVCDRAIVTAAVRIVTACDTTGSPVLNRFPIVIALFAAGCAGSSATSPAPASPSPIATPAVPSTVTLSGTVTATNGGQPLSGATVDANGSQTVSSPAGGYVFTLPPSSLALTMTIQGTGLLTHRTYVLGGSSRAVNLNAIALNGFDLAFYRALIRNGFEAPATLQPLRRWTRTPSIYLKTVDEAGEAIHGPTLDLIEAALKDAVPRWTSRVLGTPTVERGTGTRVGTSGWITVRFPATTVLLDQGSCGQAQIAVDGGWIELGYHGSTANGGTCRTATAVIAPHVVEHEVGHALGFYHSDRIGDLMYRSSWFDPTGLPTDRELAHAAIAYARPVGNTDPDNDPSSAVNLTPIVVR
jgi:hypothetical protein